MSKTASSIRTSPFWEGTVSFGFQPAGASEEPQRDGTSCDVRICTHDRGKHPFARSHPWNQPRDNKEEWNLPLIPQRYDRGPSSTCKEDS
jgi:hypothetical protein